MKYWKAFWESAKNKWSVYLGALVVFLPQLQTELPTLIPYLPHDAFATWIQNQGMHILGGLIIFFRIRREFMILVRSPDVAGN